MRRSACLAIAAIMTACAPAAQRPQDLSAGPEPTEEQVNRAVITYLQGALKDPDSLKQFRLTRRPYAREYQDNKWAPWKAGWVVCFEYNAKNSYGGYVGLKQNAVLMGISQGEPYVWEAVHEILVSSWC